MPKIQFFPLDATYKVKDNKSTIYLFGRAVDGKTICILDENFLPYFWVILKKGESMSKFRNYAEGLQEKNKNDVYRVEKTEVSKKQYLGETVEAVKISVNQPASVVHFREIIKKRKDVRLVLEADIQYARRYLIDNNITPSILHEVDGEEAKERTRCDYVIKVKKIEQISEDTIKPRILAFDIETYNPSGKNIQPEKYPIVMVALYGKKLKKVITWKKFKTEHKYIEFVDGEADLLTRLKEEIEAYDPDIITGYYSDGFDLPYIRTRADKYKINLDLGWDYSNLKMSKGKTPAARITGMVHIDAFRFTKFIMGGSLETDYFDLSSVAEELLGERKLDVELEGLADAWDNHPQKLESFCEYNLHDSLLTFKLCEKIMPNILELVKIVSLQLFDTSRMSFSQLVEWYLLKQAPRFNVLAPNKPGHDEIRERMSRRFKGAFVFEPKPGMYKDIAVFDFRSLYPTIIASHNISPATVNVKCTEKERDYAPLEGKKTWFCKGTKGFLPRMIEDLITRRMRIKEIMKSKEDKMLDARSYSLKILANAFYGYLGFYASRWYSFDCGEAVTAWGRHYIQQVIKKAQDSTFDVLYSDTDSVFLSLDGKDKNTALKFAEKINLELPELMELEFEGFYPRGIFVSAKLTGYGAKKKYALLGENNKITIKGFETVRRNWSKISKETQEEVIGIILKENDVDKAVKYVQKVVKDLRENKVELDKVTIRTQLQKEISEYEQYGPHVAVADRMKKKGIPVGAGTMVEYVITGGKDKIRDRARMPEEVTQKDYDPDYYINHQVVPAVEKIFEVLGKDIKAEVESKDQSKLQSFFGKK
ncbi:DNA-directed DNA polymerase [candidate division KSB1 bacterium]